MLLGTGDRRAAPVRSAGLSVSWPVGSAIELTVMPPQTDTPSAPDSSAGSALDPQIAAALKRDPAGLVAAVIQQHDSGEVLMLGWMDDEAIHRTLTTGRVTFFSRSRNAYWRKGDTSGHVQWVKSAAIDCDGDALLIRVDQVGAACHTGTRTCFVGRDLDVVTGPDSSH